MRNAAEKSFWTFADHLPDLGIGNAEQHTVAAAPRHTVGACPFKHLRRTSARSPRLRAGKQPRSNRLSRSPQMTSKLGGAFVNSTLPLHEPIQRLRARLVCQRIPESAGPFGPGALIDLGGIRSAANYCCKRLLLIERSNMPQPQCFLRAFQSAVLSHPPCNQLKHGRQIDVDCVSLSASLALVPGVLNPQQILLQCSVGIRNVVPGRHFHSG